MIIDLPYPPSANKLYRKVGHTMLISSEGRRYYRDVRGVCLEQLGLYKPMQGHLHIEIDVYPGDNRKRDLDNTLKAIFDSLTKAKVIQDDSQLKKITAEMFPKQEEKYVRIRLTPHTRNPL
jgi:crossover junction endodeoxyribonuclease RusA